MKKSNMNNQNDLLDAALEYAEKGWRVFPLHDAAKGGKAPKTKHGHKDATTNPVQITTWWTNWPDANIGLATGPEIFVLDIDGEFAERQLRDLGHEIPDSLTVKTGRGRHVYLKGDTEISSGASMFGDPEITEEERLAAEAKGQKLGGVDWRCNGGYVVTAPSIHASGAVYEMLDPDVELEPIPDWIRAAIAAKLDAKSKRGPLVGEDANAETIPKNHRNNDLTSIGGSYRARGLGFSEINMLLQNVNTERCDPPLPAAEVKRIAESVATYDAPEQVQPWGPGFDYGELKKAGVDEKTIEAAREVQQQVKTQTKKAGNFEVVLTRFWSRYSLEVEYEAKITYNDTSVTVGKFDMRTLKNIDVVRDAALDRDVKLPRMKKIRWEELVELAVTDESKRNVEISLDATAIGACVAVIREYINGSTIVGKREEVKGTKNAYVKDDFVFVAAKELRQHVDEAVRDAARKDVNVALEILGKADFNSKGTRSFKFPVAEVLEDAKLAEAKQ